MAYHTYYPFKVRTYTATTTATNGQTTVPVVARCRYVGGFYATTPLTSFATAAYSRTVSINGTAITGLNTTITTSTGDSATNLGAPTANTFLKAGDVLTTVASSCIGGTITHIVQEF